MIIANTLSASASAYRLGLEKDMLGGIDQRVQNRRGNDAGRFLKHLAVGESRDGGHDGVSPIELWIGTVIQMSASENDGSQQQSSIRRPQLLHDRILEQGAEQDLLGKGGRGEDYQKTSQ